MEDRKTVIFPSLLFAVFFILIAITGIVQIKIIQKNLGDLLRGQGEIFFNHLKKEIDTNLEYLSLLDTSPSIVTPRFLNIMVYDEAIVEELYNQLTELPELELRKIPFQNVVIMDEKGKILQKKGTLTVPRSFVRPLVTKKQDVFIQMPSGREPDLVMGVKTHGRIVFLDLDDAELERLRKKFIVKEIIENEGKRFDISGINVYDAKERLYLTTGEKRENPYVFSEVLRSKYLPQYRIEILLSRATADNIFKRMAINFVLILILLLVLGALSTYATFLLQKKHASKMKEMESEIEMKERLVSLGKLASGMAHEIRNPLNAISISVQRLKREFAPGEDKKEDYDKFIDIIRGELRRVDRIVEEFLLSTKSRVPFSPEKLHDVVEDVVVILGEKARIRNVTIVNRVGQDIVVECQKERLKQAFYNVVVNGIESISTAGTVEIWSERAGKTATICVRDTGSGIKQEELRSIFEYYYTTKDKGMGLGLPISYMIVKDHGGDIKVFSEKGKGTTFMITLPFTQTAPGKMNE